MMLETPMRRWLLIPILGLMASFAAPAVAKNVALLIGNSNYSVGQLANPANDANDLANTLRAIGFETIVRMNVDGDAMRSSIRDFGDKLKNNDGIGLFFFAGHGVQVNGENYLLPVSVPLRSEQDVEKYGVQANMVLRYMEDSKNRVNVVVLDACRNNPFIKTRSVKTRGLAPMDAPSGSLVAFSTAPGTEASDGSGRNGLYTKHLMASMKVPGLTVEQVFKRTREGVEVESEREIGHKQSPREESSLKGGDIYFVPPVTKKEGGASQEEVELAYWNSISGSNNPADFETYLSQYPQGRFADLARNRLAATKNPTLARNDSRAVDDGGAPAPYYGGGYNAPPPPPQLAMARPAGGIASSSGFSFSQDEGTVKAAEFLSISCRDIIRNKRVRLEMSGRGNAGAPLRQAMTSKLQSVGVKVASAAGTGGDLVIRGVVETVGGVNSTIGVNEVDMQADFSLLSAGGRTLATASVSGGAYADRNKRAAVRDVWDEKSEEIVGKLFQDYCAGR
jgi:Caspase domain